MEEEEKEAISPYMGPSHPIVINEVIEHFIRSISERLDEPTYGKLLRAIDFVNRENLKIIYRNNDGISPYIEILDETGNESCRFSIRDFHSTGSCDLSIWVEDKYKGQGLSRLLIASMIYCLRSNRPPLNKDTILAIDIDASKGFWDEIGMKKNRHCYSEPRDPRLAKKWKCEYEKIISLSDLSKWTFGGYDIFPINGGKTRKSKKTKKTKTKKTKTKKTKTKTKKI